jgi:hypothetical protein
MEQRIINATTGGAKGQKMARFDLLPPDALFAIAEQFGHGAAKYAERNWERGVDWSLPFAALQRHVWAWWGGEDIDPESGQHHLAAVGWHALALLTYALDERYASLDDRPSSTNSAPNRDSQ